MRSIVNGASARPFGPGLGTTPRLMRRAFFSRKMPVILLVGAFVLSGLPACLSRLHDRLVYDQRGVRVGIQPDPTIDASLPGGINAHPVHRTEGEIRTLLKSIQVSGYSGTIAGLFVTPQPIPFLTDEELHIVAAPITVALGRAGPRERVFFSIPNLEKPYHRERTEGVLFVRGSLFYLTLSDHSAFIRTDSGGGDDQRDPRDTKGMKLWAVRPAKAATPPPTLSPHWGPYEKVHIAVPTADVVALEPPSSAPGQDGGTGPSPAGAVIGPRAAPPGTGSGVSESEADLRLQIRELTSSNLELRARLQEQTKDLQALKEELIRIQRELEKASKPRPRRKAPPAGPP